MADAGGALPQRLTDAELWRSVEETVRRVLLPAIAEGQEWAQAVAVQLAGLARYAAGRPSDTVAARVDELAGTLDALAVNEIVAAVWAGDRSPPAVMAAAGAALAAAVGRDDAAADEVRAVLRAVVVRHLDDELAVTGPLVQAFRGQLDE
jgi:hypothetical protein